MVFNFFYLMGDTSRRQNHDNNVRFEISSEPVNTFREYSVSEENTYNRRPIILRCGGQNEFEILAYKKREIKKRNKHKRVYNGLTLKTRPSFGGACVFFVGFISPRGNIVCPGVDNKTRRLSTRFRDSVQIGSASRIRRLCMCVKINGKFL